MQTASDTFHIGDVAIRGRVLVAPMAGVTDLPFRRACAKCGAPYVASEMVAGEMLATGRPDMVRRLAGEDIEPMVVQIAAREARWFAAGAKMAEEAGAYIVDLNFGCPAREVAGKLSGAALMCDPARAQTMIAAAVGATSRPVTVKMRLGWDDASKNAPELAALAESCGAAAVTVHARTRNQFYAGRADWRAVAAVKAAVRLPVIVNGDIVDAASFREAMARSGADAAMIGRAIVGRPWLAATLAGTAQPDEAAKLAIALDHFADTLRFYGDTHGVKIFRKHLAAYIEAAARPSDPAARRAEKSRLCRLTDPAAIETGLIGLWQCEQLG